jgi:hypothetical protein
MNHWRELEGAAEGRDVLVIGNGPSRVGHAIDDPRLLTIACNAYWREAVPDFLVCYDAPQSVAALEGGSCSLNLIVPEQREEQVVFTPKPIDEHRIWEVSPHQGGGNWFGVYSNPSWSPLKRALGNLAGLLAYQVALIMRPRAIYLHGMDCAGIVEGDRVRLSAIDEKTAGYGPSTVPFDAIQGAAPRSWDQYRTLWHALTRWGMDRGIPTFRVRDAGALDWLEVRHPCPDRRTEERPGLPTRR